MLFLLIVNTANTIKLPNKFKTWEQVVDSVRLVKQQNAVDSNMLLVVEYIKSHEGFRAKPYTCTGGQLTIGYGTSVTNYKYFMNKTPEEITVKEAEAALKEILKHCYFYVKDKISPETSAGEIWAISHLAYCCGTNHKLVNELIKVHNEGSTKEFINNKWLTFADKDMRLFEISMYIYFKMLRKLEAKMFKTPTSYPNLLSIEYQNTEEKAGKFSKIYIKKLTNSADGELEKFDLRKEYLFAAFFKSPKQ